LVDAVARNDWELLDFLLQKKPNQFDLSFTKMCVRQGFIKVMDWWREAELIELINSLDTVFFSAIFCYTQINEAI
jgi:hypothetical protein